MTVMMVKRTMELARFKSEEEQVVLLVPRCTQLQAVHLLFPNINLKQAQLSFI